MNRITKFLLLAAVLMQNTMSLFAQQQMGIVIIDPQDRLQRKIMQPMVVAKQFDYLLSTDFESRNVSEIAFQVGFNHLSYWARSFKAQYGQPPSEYGQN